MPKFSNTDAIIVGMATAAVTLLGTTIAFLTLWRIAIEDRNAVWVLYYDEAGIPEEDRAYPVD